MLIFDFRAIGNRLLTFRKSTGMTQAELAEKAGLSDRTYADIERGTVNMRLETLLRICDVLRITPNDILTQETENHDRTQEEIISCLSSCSQKDRETAIRLISVFIDSLDKA